ncbi:sulfotransferase domain-containing protein [Ectothiorhodospira haloalkaliphila]|uniref:sulfotransferase domain-containing protein n=1 Tax=Ectothiorhodospira haloalkaliphila TaxID=421628 RepID=UPI002378635C|nr:sulfotransferase domain-containing protein [Ectothiorhodospira haloalkaliphila]
MTPWRRFRRWWLRRTAHVQIISYPKCGRTWLVMLISQAIERHYGVHLKNPLRLRDYHRSNREIPTIYAHHDGGPEFKQPHELETDKGVYRRSRVIFLVRDPRDVLVSSFFQQTRRNINFEGSLSSYVRASAGGLDTLVSFYNIWARNRHVPSDFLQIRYEDMRRDPLTTLRQVMDFCGLEQISEETLAEAVEFCRFENMRRMEMEGRHGTRSLSARNQSDDQTFKVRKGQVGGHLEHMSEEDLMWINTRLAASLDSAYPEYRSPQTPPGPATAKATNGGD